MSKLEKIRDVSVSYKVTTSTLRYYEKMGLIENSRCESSGYRLYDEAALIRLRQILILRKMNISIGDIREIFATNHSDTVLSVLDKKVEDIDSEVALLHELKELVLAFIRQIRQINFYNEADVKMLFDRAMEIETSLMGDNLANLLDTSAVIDEQLISVAVENKPAEGFSHNEPKIVNMTEQESGQLAENVVSVTAEGYEIVKAGPYRFIGKSIYARAFGQSHDVFGSFWGTEQCKQVFEELDRMPEYASDEKHDTALLTWDLFDWEGRKGNDDIVHGANCFLGYTVGRFMKADTPVPENLDYIDIPETYIARSWYDIPEIYVKRGVYEDGDLDTEGKLRTALEQQGLYESMHWKFMAEVYPGKNESNKAGFGYYIACRPKT